jgi:hypothetical protein
MALRMVGLIPRKSGGYIARKAIPHDMREAYAKLHGVRRTAHAVGRGLQSSGQGEHGEWLAEIETRIERLRAYQNGHGQSLTQKQSHALAGQWVSLVHKSA